MAGTLVGGMDLDALLAGIRSAESGGAHAPDTASTGYTATNSIGALGAYQFLPSTVLGPKGELQKSDPANSALAKVTATDFLGSHALQDQAATQYIKDGIAAGASSPVQIGEFWLGDKWGLAHPTGGTDGKVTPLQHGLDVLTGYNASFGASALDKGASALANALGGVSTVNGADPATGASDADSAAKVKAGNAPSDPLGFGALTAWLTTAAHNLPLYVVAFILVLGGFMWLAESSGAVDKAASLAKLVAV